MNTWEIGVKGWAGNRKKMLNLYIAMSKKQ